MKLHKEIIGNCTLYNADCMDIMSQYPDKYFDLAIVDPPYGIGASKEFISMALASPKCGNWNPKLRGYEKKAWDKKPPNDNYFKELFRVSKRQIIFGGQYYNLPKSGGWIIWDKCVCMPTLSKCELMWTSFLNHTELFKFLWSGFRKGEKAKRIHPTQKPAALYKWLLSKYTKQGDKILDTHFGSGSIAIACNELGFELIASELDRDYFKAACSRVREANKQNELFSEAS